jgi:SNF family Na+-dependent transporter
LKRSKVDKLITKYGISVGMLLIASFHILKNWIEVSDNIAVPYLMLICLFMIYSGFRQGGCFRRDKNSGDKEA